jgi:ribose 5-phosphate isomerase RpiB
MEISKSIEGVICVVLHEMAEARKPADENSSNVIV